MTKLANFSISAADFAASTNLVLKYHFNFKELAAAVQEAWSPTGFGNRGAGF